jgi:uncharacterized membrane protein YkvA (DUF1232 family)
MAEKASGIIKQLGWSGFFKLLAHLPSFLKLIARLVGDPRVSLGAKLLLAAALAYVVLPSDMVPDFLPGVGQVDDVAVIFAGLKLFLRFCPPQVVREHLRAIAAGQ